MIAFYEWIWMSECGIPWIKKNIFDNFFKTYLFVGFTYHQILENG